MDPISQGTLGALAGQTVSPKKYLFYATVMGALAGMAADLDVLIRSSDNPFFALEFHRHFTHSLFFIPLGGLICAWFFYHTVFRKACKTKAIRFSQVYVWSTLGYATHALLDGCTSYGTLLLWPLSNERFSWDLISIIDPLFTLPLLALTLLTVKRHSKRYLAIALIWGTAYLSFAAWMHQRALGELQTQIQLRQHQSATQISAKPTFANALIWRGIYLHQGQYYQEAIRVTPFSTQHLASAQITKLNESKHLAWLSTQSQQFKDLQTFSWFAQGHLGIDPENPHHVADVRYSSSLTQLSSIWRLQLDPQAGESDHAGFEHQRDNAGRGLKEMWRALINKPL